MFDAIKLQYMKYRNSRAQKLNAVRVQMVMDRILEDELLLARLRTEAKNLASEELSLTIKARQEHLFASKK